MILHAITEGFLILRQRAAVSAVLALALAVPIAFAGVGAAVNQWLDPVAELSDRDSSVAVLLHPDLDADQRRQWVADMVTAHPEISITEVSSGELVDRLGRWFPYLEELVGTGDAAMPPLIEVSTSDLGILSGFADRPEVLAVGPQSSVQQLLGRVARKLSMVIAVLSSILLAAAILLAAVWVHLELYRHADELTIMRLVGATEGTIRGPFLVAVGIPGLVAGTVAIVVSLTTVEGLSGMVSVLGLPALNLTPKILVFQMAAAVVLPVVAAALTLARHASEEFES